jgi:hypothetical protein
MIDGFETVVWVSKGMNECKVVAYIAVIISLVNNGAATANHKLTQQLHPTQQEHQFI